MFVSLRVTPTWTYIDGDYPVTLVDKVTSYRPQGYYFSPAYKRHTWDGYNHLLYRTGDSDRFPSGLLNRVESVLKLKGVEYNIEHKYREPEREGSHGLNFPFELRDYQRASIEIVDEHMRGIFHMATNSGKSAIAAGIVDRLHRPKTLVLVHKQELLQQNKAWYEEYLNCSIGVISAEKTDIQHITIGMEPTLARRLKKKEVKAYLDTVDLVISDEAHHSPASSWNGLLMEINAPYRYGFTGTAFRTDGRDLHLAAAIGEIICHVSNDDLVELGFSVKPYVKYYIVNTPDLNKQAKEESLDYQYVYRQGITENQTRNNLIVDVTLKHANEGRHTLIIVFEIKHGTNLQEAFKDSDWEVPFIYGGSSAIERQDAIEKFRRGDTRVLIASSILDEGVDIPTIDVLVLGAGGESAIQLLQRVGRGLRWKESEKVHVVDFLDDTHRWLKQHSIKRYQLMKSQKTFDVEILDPTESGIVI